MSPASDFVPRPELDRTFELIREQRANEIEAAKRELRAESHKELKVIHEKLSSLEKGQAQTNTEVTALGKEFAAMRCDVAKLSTGQEGIREAVQKLAEQTVTVVAETAEGRTVIKHFRSWRTVGTDARDFLKKFWPHLTALWFAYHAIGGWLRDHGITWATLMAGHAK